MVGIVSLGAYVPWHRLGPGTAGWTASGERAVANFDEDSVTMAVAATRACLAGSPREKIDALYFATTTPPYREKSNASIVAVASDLSDRIHCMDFANSLRAGTSALKSAIDAVRSGSNRQVAIAAADVRVTQPRSGLEEGSGDGAAALLIGSSDVVAEFEDCFSVSHEMLDVWKEESDRFTRSWEDRFVAEEGYLKILPQAVSGLMTKHQLKPADFGRVVLYAPDTRRHSEMAKKLGFDLKTQVQDPMLNQIGNAGTASVLITLAAALETARPGDRILLAGYGDGADAFLFKATAEIEAFKKTRRSLRACLEAKRILPDYETYLGWRGLLNKAAAVRRPPFRAPSPAAMLREVGKNLRFHGSRCKQCGYPQYPPQTICSRCHTRGASEAYSFADKKAKIFTYTLDALAPTPDPPMVVAVINFEGGGRAFSIMTDRDANLIEIGMPVEMTFRSLYVAEGIHNYFWKCMPAR